MQIARGILAPTYGHGPVDVEVQWHEYEVVEKEVHGLGPAPHGPVASSLPALPATQLGQEEGAEAVDPWPGGGLAGRALHDQGEVEVDHLRGTMRMQGTL